MEIFGADPTRIRNFWENFLGRPRSLEWARRHPILYNKAVADLVTSIPCVLHSDAGPCTKRKSANCVSWSSLLAAGPEKLCKLLAFSHVKRNQGGSAEGRQARDLATKTFQDLRKWRRGKWILRRVCAFIWQKMARKGQHLENVSF